MPLQPAQALGPGVDRAQLQRGEHALAHRADEADRHQRGVPAEARAVPKRSRDGQRQHHREAAHGVREHGRAPRRGHHAEGPEAAGTAAIADPRAAYCCPACTIAAAAEQVQALQEALTFTKLDQSRSRARRRSTTTWCRVTGLPCSCKASRRASLDCGRTAGSTISANGAPRTARQACPTGQFCPGQPSAEAAGAVGGATAAGSTQLHAAHSPGAASPTWHWSLQHCPHTRTPCAGGERLSCGAPRDSGTARV